MRSRGKTQNTQDADSNVSTPEWLSDEKVAAFMAEIDAPEAALVGELVRSSPKHR